MLLLRFEALVATTGADAVISAVFLSLLFLLSFARTMSGSVTGEQRGIIPRSVEKVLEQAQALSTGGWSYGLEASFLEIYNETIRDLLCKDSKESEYAHTHTHPCIFLPQRHYMNDTHTRWLIVACGSFLVCACVFSLDIKRDASGRTNIPGLTRCVIGSQSDVSSLMTKAAKNRASASTNMNEHSSRSHSVFTLYLTASNPLSKQSLSGSLNLCDLAGSERLSKSGASGERMKETQSINKSLSSLSDVFLALSQKQAHVPCQTLKHTCIRSHKCTTCARTHTASITRSAPFFYSAGGHQTVCACPDLLVSISVLSVGCAVCFSRPQFQADLFASILSFWRRQDGDDHQPEPVPVQLQRVPVHAALRGPGVPGRARKTQEVHREN